MRNRSPVVAKAGRMYMCLRCQGHGWLVRLHGSYMCLDINPLWGSPELGILEHVFAQCTSQTAVFDTPRALSEGPRVAAETLLPITTSKDC